MKYLGAMTELENDFDEGEFDVSDAIISKTKASLEWEEDGLQYHALLSSADGVHYYGRFGVERLNDEWTIQAIKYTADDGGVLLYAKWAENETGNGGCCFFELEPSEA